MFNKPFPLAVLLLIGFGLIRLIDHDSPERAQAMTAHGTKEKTMVTVPLDAGMEAVVTLDHKTGDMSGYVLNRLNAQFFIRYRHNITNEFPEHQGAYLMATGMADFRGFNSNTRIASGVIYVSEENSGRVVAYALPWNTQFAASNAPRQDLAFIALDQAATRFTQLR